MGIISEILAQSVPGLTEDNRLSLRLVERVGEMLAGPPLWGCSQLVVDGTGVGAPVVDMFRQKRLVPIAITITGGDTVTGERDNYRVPKRYLVSTCKSCCRPGC